MTKMCKIKPGNCITTSERSLEEAVREVMFVKSFMLKYWNQTNYLIHRKLQRKWLAQILLISDVRLLSIYG